MCDRLLLQNSLPRRMGHIFVHVESNLSRVHRSKCNPNMEKLARQAADHPIRGQKNFDTQFPREIEDFAKDKQGCSTENCTRIMLCAYGVLRDCSRLPEHPQYVHRV